MNARGVQDRVEVELEVDALEVLPDEKIPNVKAKMTGAKNASGKKTVQIATAVEVAKMVEDAATWDQLKRKGIKCRTVHNQQGFSPLL